MKCIASIGAKARTLQGKVFNMCPKYTKGMVYKITGYGILKEDWLFPALNFLSERFPESVFNYQ